MPWSDCGDKDIPLHPTIPIESIIIALLLCSPWECHKKDKRE